MIEATWEILTPTTAAGAVAIVQVEGDVEGALRALGQAPVEVGRVSLRRLAGIDTGLVIRWDDRTLQLMPHAGPEVQRALCERLSSAGIAPAQRPGATRYPEAADDFERLMLRALARAASPLAIDLLLDQPRRWREAGFRAPPPPPARAAPHALDRLINPPLVVALGATNIGKSTLVNALAGRAVALVADEPGTTRDHVGVMLDLAGLVVRYADTPGLREDPDPAERAALDIALDLARRADLVLLCGDHAAPPPALPAPLSPEATAPPVRAALRADLGLAAWPHDAGVCAPRAGGVAELVALLRERLVPAAALADPRPWRFWDALGG